MKPYSQFSEKERANELARLNAEYNRYKDMSLKLDMSRGKPSPEQLDLSNGLLENIDKEKIFDAGNGADARNYGLLTGTPAIKKLFSELLGYDEKNIVVCGNSSLQLMYDFISRSYTHGVFNGSTPWMKLPKVRWLCPVPGYDRHFAITERFGFELIEIPMDENGPDMDRVERLVREDSSVKGMWCVPIYSNPTGIVYSDAVLNRIASMKCAADDFTVMCDMAYCAHHLYDEITIPDLVKLCEKHGNPDRAVVFASTSKMTFAGAGVSCVAGGNRSIESITRAMSLMTISYDKINQQLHAAFLKDKEGIKAHMRRHAEIIRPKFETVLGILEQRLGGLGIAEWSNPKGGYFISFKTPNGTAKRIVELCAEAGVKLTPAGATFPYGVDNSDSNIRIAPSYPSKEELATASELLCTATRIAALTVD